eukprot:768571-Hanusia_phi.AAC.3
MAFRNSRLVDREKHGGCPKLRVYTESQLPAPGRTHRESHSEALSSAAASPDSAGQLPRAASLAVSVGLRLGLIIM